MNYEQIYKFVIPESKRVHIQNSKADAVLEKSMKYNGCLSPLIVYKWEEDKLVVIDGVRRLRIANKLGLESLPYFLVTPETLKSYKTFNGEDSEDDRSEQEDEKAMDVKSGYAKWSINLTNGKINRDELVSVVKLLREKKMGYGAIAQRIGYSRSGVKKILESVEKETESKKQFKKFKSLIRTLDKILNDIPEESKAKYSEAFATVKSYLQSQIETE